MDFEHVIPTLDQIETLYQQLNTRSFSVSHKTTPSFDEHTQFVRCNPYREWMIVNDAETPIGNVYIQFDNSIGLNCAPSVSPEEIYEILRNIYELYSPMPAIPSVRVGEFFLKVASSNTLMHESLSHFGFREVERTFVLSKNFLEVWGIKSGV